MHVLIMFIINFNPVSYFLCVIFSLAFFPLFPYALHNSKKHYDLIYSISFICPSAN